MVMQMSLQHENCTLSVCAEKPFDDVWDCYRRLAGKACTKVQALVQGAPWNGASHT
jgi:hypothetical protein